MNRTATQFELESLTVSDESPVLLSLDDSRAAVVGVGLTPRAALFDAIDRVRHTWGWSTYVVQASQQFATLCREMPAFMCEEVLESETAQYVAVFRVDSVSQYAQTPFMQSLAVA